MLKVQRFVVNMVEENCYVLYDETREAAIVDCGARSPEEEQQIADFIDDHSLRPTLALLTHAHFDHAFGTRFLSRTYGLLPRMLRDELPTYRAIPEHTRLFLHRDIGIQLPHAGAPLSEGESVGFGTTQLRVIHTPGHTPGGACYYCSEARLLLSGDSLFRSSIGRCDLPGGNPTALVASLSSKVLTLPPETAVLPGHGPQTTIADELRYNPYLSPSIG